MAESTELELILAHKGFVWLEIETHGVAAHGSRPQLGVDAIAKMGPVLVALEQLDRELRAHPTHPLLGSGSLHASLIQGGRSCPATRSAACCPIERRTIPGETPERVEQEVRAIFERLRRSDPAFQADVRQILARAPLETPAEAPIVRSLAQSAAKILGHPAAVSGVPYWTDAASLWAAGIPTLLFGPAGTGAHAVEEWVDLESVKTCAQIYLETAVDFCEHQS